MRVVELNQGVPCSRLSILSSSTHTILSSVCNSVLLPIDFVASDDPHRDQNNFVSGSFGLIAVSIV